MGRQSKRFADTARDVPPDPLPTDVIRVVERAFELMRCFDSSHQSLSNGEICQRTALPASTVSRLTRTLTTIGQLSYSAREQRYKLGTTALTMSASWLRGLKSRSTIGTLMMELAESVPGIIAMSACQQLEMVLLECRRSERAVGVFSEVGSRKSVAYTASGRAYLLAQTTAKREQFLKRLAKRSYSDAQRLGAWLHDNAEAFAKNGMATSIGEENPHITGIAVPVWSPEQADFFSLSIGMISSACNADTLRQDLGPKLLLLRDKIQDLL